VDTPQEIAIGSYLRGAWATFAKDPVNVLRTYGGGNGTGWPTSVPGENTLVRLAYQNLTGPNLAPSEMYDSQCNATFIVPPSTLANGSTNATVTGLGTPSGSGTGTAPAATVTKSEGGKREIGFGLLVFFGALIFAL
jgi:hypothetical protein